MTGATVHERTDVRIHEVLRASLRPDRTESQQQELHRRDESTIWFGVARERGVEESTFKDHGRFWNMMKESSRRGARNLYPSLVSFIGDTGGKRVFGSLELLADPFFRCWQKHNYQSPY